MTPSETRSWPRGATAAHIITGTTWSRPSLTNALDYSRPGDTLVVTRLNRLGRNLYETVTTIANLTEREINVQVFDPALDTSRPVDKVVVNVIASLARAPRKAHPRERGSRIGKHSTGNPGEHHVSSA